MFWPEYPELFLRGIGMHSLHMIVPVWRGNFEPCRSHKCRNLQGL